MEQHGDNTIFLKKEMTKLRSKYYILDQDKKCDNCGGSIFKDVFFYFPCGHAFLKNCLKDVIRRLEVPRKQIEIDMLESRIKRAEQKKNDSIGLRNSGGSQKHENTNLENPNLLNELYVITINLQDEYDQRLQRNVLSVEMRLSTGSINPS